jgi:hypothetical protein
MYQFLDEQDMWSLVEKNPKEMGVLEKHNATVSLRINKNIKNHVFLNWNCNIHLNKNKTK